MPNAKIETKQTENQAEKQPRKKSAKANPEAPTTENAPEGATVAASERKPRVPRLSPELRAQAQEIIAKRDRKAAGERKRGEPKEELVVFAFRLTPEERDLIHKAAGAAKASRFVRALAVAAAARDEGAIKLLLEHVAGEAA